MAPRLPGSLSREGASSKGSSCFEGLLPDGGGAGSHNYSNYHHLHHGNHPHNNNNNNSSGGGGCDVHCIGLGINGYNSSGTNNDLLLKEAGAPSEVQVFAADNVSVTSSDRLSFPPKVKVFEPDSPPSGMSMPMGVAPPLSLDGVRTPGEEPEILSRKKEFLEGSPTTPTGSHHQEVSFGNLLAQDMHRLMRSVDEKIDKLAWEVGLANRRLEPGVPRRPPHPRSLPSPTPSLDSHRMAREMAKSMPTLPAFPKCNSMSSSERRLSSSERRGPTEEMVSMPTNSSIVTSGSNEGTKQRHGHTPVAKIPSGSLSSKRSSRVAPLPGPGGGGGGGGEGGGAGAGAGATAAAGAGAGAGAGGPGGADQESTSNRKAREMSPPQPQRTHLPSFQEDNTPCGSDSIEEFKAKESSKDGPPCYVRPRLTREDSRLHPSERLNAGLKAGKGVELLFRKKRGRSDCARMVWSILEHPNESWAGIFYDKFVLIFTFISVLVAVAQTVEHHHRHHPGVFILELFFDAFFMFEVLVRVWSCPSKSHFFFSAFNCIDVVTLIPAFGRTVQCTLNWQGSQDIYDVPEVYLVVMPSVRLLRILRRFKSVKLLSTAFQNVLQSLPVLLYTMSSISFFFAALIVLVEPRTNVHSLPHALWLTIVTMTTVGYGDITPTTKSGYVAVSSLVIVSVLFMAMPIGIIGHSFTIAWSDRKQILLIERTRELLSTAGYTPQDMHVLFSSFDYNMDGYLDLHEFRSMFNQIGCGLQQTDLAELFEFIDRDRNGGIDDIEFVRAVFAKNFDDYRSEGHRPDDNPPQRCA